MYRIMFDDEAAQLSRSYAWASDTVWQFGDHAKAFAAARRKARTSGRAVAVWWCDTSGSPKTRYQVA